MLDVSPKDLLEICMSVRMRVTPLKCQLLTICAVIVLILGTRSGNVMAAKKADQPNFILFIADDMAWDDCGAYGHPNIRTPHVDQLARDGMRFDNAYLTCSSCSPSRSSIITGRYPHNTGAKQLHLPLPGEQVTFIEKLKESGYYTASAGKWHLGPASIPKFDRVRQKMNLWVDTLKERPKDQPFFMWFAFSDPHRPYQKGTIPKPHTPEDVILPPYLPDDPQVRKDMALYYDEIARLDGVVGNCVTELEKQGVTENTVIIFISDNGRPFPRCKTTVYDSGIKTPFVVKWPKKVKAGSVTKSLVSSLDIAPTVLSLAGLTPGETFQGVSFEPILKNPKADVREAVYAEHNWHDFDDHGRAVRTSQYKYIRNYYTDIPGTPPADAVSSMTFQAMRKLREQGGLSVDQLNPFVKPRPKEELFDVNADPDELTNLAGNPGYTKILKELRKTLKEWERKTDDVVPETRRKDEFDRETGARLPEFQKPKKTRRKTKKR